MKSVESPSSGETRGANGRTPSARPTPDTLGFKEKLGYGLGDTASHFVWDMVGFWLLFFYTDVYKIPAAAAGTIIYAGATYVLLMTAYAAINLPYSSMAAVMTSDTYERAGLNTYRFICAFGGQFVVTGLALTLAKFFGRGDKALGFQYTLVLFGLLSLVFFFITFKTCKERVQPSASLPSSLKEDLKNLFRNRPWIILAIVGIVSFVMFAMQNAAIAYYFKYYIGKEENVQLFNVVGTVALIVALPLSKPLARKFGNRNVFIASSLVSGARSEEHTSELKSR